MIEDIWNELVASVWFKLTFLLAVAIASNFLFSRFGQPKIIGQILLGIVIGPSVLGVIVVDQTDPGDTVHRLAEFGAIILLFMIGLECKIKEIFTKRAVFIAIGGVVVPWFCGFLLAVLMLPDPGEPYDAFAQAVFIGAALVATSVAITAGVMKEMGIIGSSVAKTLLGAAVVDDILGMIVLAISRGIASGEGIDPLELTWVILVAIVFVGAGAYIGSKYILKAISTVEKKGKDAAMPESGFLFALSFAFLYAVIAEAIGVSAIVGAFVAGTSLAGCQYAMKFRQSTTILEWVFAPVFFLSLGILVNIWMSEIVWLFAILLTVGAILSKVVGCGLPARWMGMSKRESLAIGYGMSPRLEVAMIIALYGLTAGIITSDIYSVIVMMGLLTAVFTPYILKRVMKDFPKIGDTCAPISER